MNGRRIAYGLFVVALLGSSGCSSIEGEHRSRQIVPEKALSVSPSPTTPIGAGGVAYVTVDPLAPYWKVEVASLGMHRFKVDLTMKRIFTGGEGEVGPVIRRTAERLRQAGGYTGYTLLEQSEGIESRLILAQRVAHAVIELY